MVGSEEVAGVLPRIIVVEIVTWWVGLGLGLGLGLGSCRCTATAGLGVELAAHWLPNGAVANLTLTDGWWSHWRLS